MELDTRGVTSKVFLLKLADEVGPVKGFSFMRITHASKGVLDKNI